MKWWVASLVRRKQGFTIVELLIVIGIIGILATIVVVAYSSLTGNASDATLRSDLQHIADEFKLKALDDQVIPDGGATSSMAGDSTRITGVSIKPNKSAYDLTVPNLYYCAGDINGIKEFGLVAKGQSGKVFSYRSDSGIGELSSSQAMTYEVCPVLGFEEPYTWAYGYNPHDDYKWLGWANGEAEIITNYATNPGAEAATGWHSNNHAVYPAYGTTGVVRSGSRAVASHHVDTSINLMSLYAPGATDGNGIPISEGGIYTQSVYVRSEVPAQARLGYAYRASGSWSSTTYGSFTPIVANEWVRISQQTNVVPSGADRIRAIVNVNALTAQPSGTEAYADDFMMTKGSDLWLYRYGNSWGTGWAWNGTVNASSSSGPGEKSS